VGSTADFVPVDIKVRAPAARIRLSGRSALPGAHARRFRESKSAARRVLQAYTRVPIEDLLVQGSTRLPKGPACHCTLTQGPH
jgi:hypothetical protein